MIINDYYNALEYKEKSRGTGTNTETQMLFHQYLGSTHLSSNWLPARSTIALGHGGNAKVLKFLLQTSKHGVQGSFLIFLVWQVFPAGIYFHCSLLEGKNDLQALFSHWQQQFHMLIAADPAPVLLTSSKALKESNVLTPVEVLSLPFHSQCLSPNEI